MTKPRPTRILQVVGGMDRGGAETWLMHVLRHIDREQFRMDFLVHSERPGVYDDEIRALGGRIIPCLRPAQPTKYANNFRRILHEYGPYDVVHSHVHHFSGYALMLARRANVRHRLAHSHLDSSTLDAAAPLPRRLYLQLMGRWIARHATGGLAASRQAAPALFGPSWAADARWRVLYCGVDLAPFREPVDRAAVRAELGIAEDAFVIGHVGRFAEQKNHRFVIEVMAEIVKVKPNAYLVLVGVGALRPAIEQLVEARGLVDRVIFAGSRSDVPRIMRGAMDVFLFPSRYEGLPLVLMEVQCAGLPCVISDDIPDELDVVRTLVRRVSLKQPIGTWASATIAARATLPQDAALGLIARSPFDIHTSVKRLGYCYAAE